MAKNLILFFVPLAAFATAQPLSGQNIASWDGLVAQQPASSRVLSCGSGHGLQGRGLLSPRGCGSSSGHHFTGQGRRLDGGQVQAPSSQPKPQTNKPKPQTNKPKPRPQPKAQHKAPPRAKHQYPGQGRRINEKVAPVQPQPDAPMPPVVPVQPRPPTRAQGLDGRFHDGGVGPASQSDESFTPGQRAAIAALQRHRENEKQRLPSSGRIPRFRGAYSSGGSLPPRE